MNKSYLVTGGMGYIGMQMATMLAESGHDVVIIDKQDCRHELHFFPKCTFYQINLLDQEKLNKVIAKHAFSAVFHFAAFASVNESVSNPQLYYDNNVTASLNLLKSILKYNIPHIIFSSTSAIYGSPQYTPINEEHPTSPISPYGASKLMVEKILGDYANAYGLRYACLRYFNAAGADINGRFGENHQPETHLIPLVLQSIMNNEKIKIYGNDYDTKDGTCIRDYVHIHDICRAHILAYHYLQEQNKSLTLNLGCNKGFSILEIIQSINKVINKTPSFEFADRRDGDPAVLIADNSKAKKIIGWEPHFTLDDIINHAWKWHDRVATCKLT